METLTALWAVITAVWNTGNRWARYLIVSICGWPVLQLLFSLTDSFLLISLIALTPLASLIFLIWSYPMIIAITAAFEKGRIFLGWIIIIILTELLIGLYLILTPISNNPYLIPLLILLTSIIGLNEISKTPTPIKKFIRMATGTIFVIITLSLFFPNVSRYTAIKAGKIDSEITKLLACMEEENRNKPECQIYRTTPAAPTPTTAEEERFYIAPPDRFSEKISIPEGYWYKIEGYNKVMIKGKKFGADPIRPGEGLFGPKQNNVEFQAKSVTGQNEIVKVSLRKL